jgi:hypothetical protein
MLSTYDYAPFCVTYLWSTTASTNTFTLIACESVRYTGFPTLAAESPSGTGTTTKRTTSTTRSTTSSTSSTSSTSTSGTSTTTGPPGPTNSGDNGGSGGAAPVGAIVGGVVGGLAVIGMGAVALVFFLRKKKSGGSPSVPPSTIGGMPPTPYGSPPPQPMHQTPPPGFPPQAPYGGYYQGTPSPSQGYATPGGQQMYATPGGLTPGSPDPSKHYSSVSSEGGFMPMQGTPQHYQPYQPPIAEMGSTNAMGTHGNRAELG